MPLIITRNDITKMNVDAIVNAANNSLLGGGGVDGSIHRAAGSELLKECKALNGCETGNSKITKGYNLPSKFVIHTVGPVWEGGNNNEENLLRSCYKTSLELAIENNIETIAFPLISTGAYSFPREKAFKIASEEIEKFLKTNELTVYIVVFDNESFSVSKELADNVAQFIDDNYVRENTSPYISRAPRRVGRIKKQAEVLFEAEEASIRSLDDILTNIEDSFSKRLFTLIDIKGKDDVEVYKKANIDRKLFSKIKSNTDYKPSKTTILAFCFALELSLDETKDLLLTAGFALSRSSEFDLIIEYFISNKIYNILEVNEILFLHNQKTLGA